MFNSNKADIDYQLSNANCDIRFFNRISLDCDYAPFTWQKSRTDVSVTSSQHISHGSILPSEKLECQIATTVDINKKVDFTPSLSQVPSNSIAHIVPEHKSKIIPPKFPKPKITAMRIKTILTNDILNHLPFDVQQHLISLMPDCDKIENGQSTDEKHYSLSNTALTNDFFYKALIRFMFKLTNGKSLLSTESFINRIKSISTTTHNTPISNYCVSSSSAQPSSQRPFSGDKEQLNSASTRSNCDITDAKINCKFEAKSPIVEVNYESDNLLDVKHEKDVPLPNHSFDSLFPYDITICANSVNTRNNSEFETIPKEFDCIFSTHQSSQSLQSIITTTTTNANLSATSRKSKYKRRSSCDSLPTPPNKRPTRSTAGQLPARLKSSSPQPSVHGTLVSTLLNNSHSPKIIKPISDRKKNQGKRKYKTNDYCGQKNGVLEIKPINFHNDTILLNLRTKLSNRIHKNSLKDYHVEYPKSESTVEFSSDINGFNSKSPRSLSPGSDKLPFINSPITKNGQNHLRHLKFKNPFFENQTQSSPQWSFSSEFTSQSSVESVLSQKNIRIDVDDVSGFENLLDDIDSEEMPPPRRTLTVAAMREKMRAKKMAKEEKRKDFDKDFAFDIDRSEDNKESVHMNVDHTEMSDMSNMMAMSQHNDNDDDDDDNITNDFDSFLIDDYHVEIDDKILNYSDDLDELLLSGGNDSLLEIIMKDPDAMEIANDNFSILNSDCQHQNLMVSSDNTKCSFSNPNIQSSCNSFTNHKTQISTSTPIVDYKPSLPVSSVCRIDDSILSQALTSVIQKVDTENYHCKDSSALKSALQNAYLVDGNGLSDALKLIQRLHPEAKVTTQQFFLVNSGPQLVLSQAPPSQACSSTGSINVQSPVRSTPLIDGVITTTATTTASIITSGVATQRERNIATSNVAPSVANTLIFTNTKPTTALNAPPMLSSTLSMLPQFSAFNSNPSNMYSINSNFTNKIVRPITNAGCKFPTNNIQHHPTTSSTQKPILSNPNPPNSFGIRLQLAQNYQNPQQLNIIQSSPGQVLPTLINQPLQFLSPQPSHLHNLHTNTVNSNISLISQPQPMSKLVLLYPNLNCPQLSSDIGKHDSQQVILLSQAPKEQSTPISISSAPTFQVLNWPQFNPGLNTFLGSTNCNNVLLMNPQTLSQNQPFAINYQPSSQLITANNLLMMSGMKPTQIITPPHPILTANATSSLSINVSKPDDDSLINLIKPHTNNCCIEQLSNSSSSANSKLSFDDKSSCQLSKSLSDNFTDSDQEKSTNSPLFQLFNCTTESTLVNNNNNNQRSLQQQIVHLTVDIDSQSPSNSFYHNENNVTKPLSCQLQSPDTYFDQSDFEIPCLYSQKIEAKNNVNNNVNINVNINNIAGHEEYIDG